MSSLPLLNEVTGSTTGSSQNDITAIMCSPAVLVLVIGSGLVVYSISRGNLRHIGTQMLGTIVFALVAGLLCVVGMPSVSWAIVALPVVVVVSLIMIVVLTLMLTSPGKTHRRRRHTPKNPPKEPSMSDAYKYVMTGKGFGLL